MNIGLLQSFLENQHQPAYRLRQIIKNYYSGRCRSYADMTDLPANLRLLLADNVPYSSLTQITQKQDVNTSKALLELFDKLSIETVLMNYDSWLTACVSTQVGCPVGCTFCATGKMGFIRNLSADEIVDQIVFWNQQLYPKYIGRVVFMGMGEPFANWQNTYAAINMIQDKDKLNIGSRKISISTSGILSSIKQFTQLRTEINLAISLHSAVQSTREQLIPIARQNPLSELLKASLDYVNQQKRQLFFEYVLIKDVNDTEAEISALIRFISQHPLFYLNLIPLNSAPGNLIPTSSSRIRQIESDLIRHHISYSLRRNFGSSINAACGQLATSAQNKV